ncbi:tyrosine-protein kinase transmembrane receptor Ror2 [Nephila pilipes]|uniref:Tyrosine-protein kinase transmembrane receptor Ror2 n=1 Tax=Nephila pilipes TaxID=299642 RepID=A0A8X6ID54_NEPPI|nr:tyrosine-protein kinase transmembrane receptor Ror2 [Nephila pilipes]
MVFLAPNRRGFPCLRLEESWIRRDVRNNAIPAKVKGGRTVYNVTWGAAVILECTAEGEPPPEITWWQNGVPLRSDEPTLSHSMLTINATESTMYLCRSTNFMRSANYTVTDSKDFHIFVLTKSAANLTSISSSANVEIYRYPLNCTINSFSVVRVMSEDVTMRDCVCLLTSY